MPSSRSAGATRARRSSAAAAASRPTTSRRFGPALADTKPGRRRPQVEDRLRSAETAAPRAMPEPWLDADGTDLFPLPLPDLTLESGVFVPTQGSFLVWKHLFRTGIGKRHALPRRRLRLRDPDGAAGAQRRRARARDRHRPQRHRQHGLERVPQRRRRPRERRRRRPLPVDDGRELRPHRREPLPDAGRSLRGAERPPPARLLGPQPARPLPLARCRSCSPPTAARS